MLTGPSAVYENRDPDRSNAITIVTLSIAIFVLKIRVSSTNVCAHIRIPYGFRRKD